MMERWKTLRWFTVLLGVLGCLMHLQGCTRQAWFEGMKARERQECDKLFNNHDIQQCLERVNNAKIE